MKITTAEAVNNVGGGFLTIRAGEGVRPELHVEVKEHKPFLSTRSDAPVHIEGVTIVARYIGTTPDPAAVIEAGANVTLDRCCFRVVAETPVRGPITGTRAVALDGGALKVSGCFFENFDRAIDVSCFGGVTSMFKHCMFVHNRSGQPPSKGSNTAQAAVSSAAGRFACGACPAAPARRADAW